MQFQVPQFIDIEDKIFGPLTIKQFIYLAGGGGLAFTFFRMFPLFISIFLVLPIVALSLLLAFYKPNNRPFVMTLEAGFKYLLGNKLYIWKKEPKKIEKKEEKPKSDPIAEMNIPRLSDSKLSDLSWSLDIKEKLEDNINNN
ncbi:PrgI family protein [Candidatus Parcubacteria bacterium]|nr:PrgI family protein [Candidatus Parcubacteria bacterium]